ncbi:hypothetical protein [Faecalibacillus intestinalis]|jgi:hypothetical protein|uniref:hypothetical protein n=1 Tax=Faecalibacillus intestinalis TaxID=1982626 RepID=UPI0022E0CFDF|nr:hypothetical protein [Faecalibacillus intestinalis]
MAKQQKPAIKNSFYSLYKDTINFILIILGIFVIATVISLFLIYMPIWMWYISLIIFAVVLILKFIKDNFLYVVYLLNQRRIPLLSTELKQLDIDSVEEYANYIKKMLHGYAPREDIWRRVVINTYNCFFRNNELDEFVIARPDAYGFSSYDIFIKRKDYNLIQQTYQKGQKLDKDFLIKMNQEGINMHSNLFVSPTKYKEERIINFYDLFDANFDIKDEFKVASLKNKVELNPGYKYDMYIEYYYKLMFKNTWFEEVVKTYDIKSYI